MYSIRRFLRITLLAVTTLAYAVTACWVLLETGYSTHILIPFAVIYLATIMLLWLIIGHAFTPLKTLVQQLNTREPENLSPIPIHSAPGEIAPTLASINALFERLNDAYAREKRFTADAAHELRTPLAGIRTMAQLSLGTKDIKTCHASLDDVIRGVDRCSHVIKQLTLLNSFRPEVIMQECSTINVASVMTEMCNELKIMSNQKNITLTLGVPENLTFSANYASIQILLRNLIDNAIRYSPSGSTISLSAEQTSSGLMLNVTDEGPGIPEELRTRVFERFYRQLGTQTSGTGLGLSIVATICQIHNAVIALENNPKRQGLSVTVTFRDPAA